MGDLDGSKWLYIWRKTNPNDHDILSSACLSKAYKIVLVLRPSRIIGELDVKKEPMWSFFDRDFWGPENHYNIGFFLCLSNVHLFSGKGCLGSSRNNIGELFALFYLLKIAKEKDIEQLQVLGDSTLTIKWMKEEI